jgi:TRAP-type C4-dicarboxylate transport system permease small subunit
MHTLSRIIEKIENICLYGGVTAVLVLMLATCTDVILRKLFSSAIPGLFEITQEYLMVGLVFLSMSYVYRKRAHVSVTLFLKYIPVRLKPALDMLLEILALAFFGLLTFVSWEAFLEAWQSGETSSGTLGYLMAPAYFLVPLGAGVTTLRVLVGVISPSTIAAAAPDEH